jgi:hypothetical protein
MAFDVNALRSFLVASPKPAKILVTCGDGEAKEILPPKGVGGITWAGVARSIETLDPAKVELFDADDKLLRAQRFDAALPDAETTLPEVLKRDAESARLVVFAQLIATAYKHSTETAFTKMVDIFERLDARQARVENRLEHAEAQYRRIMQDRVDEAFEEAEEAAKAAEEQQQQAQGDPAKVFLAAMAQGAQARPAPPPNGKKG